MDWLDDIHIQTDSWQKTQCPMATEIFTFSDDDGYNERRGFIEDVEYTKANGLTVDRVFTYNDGVVDGKMTHLVDESTWDLDVAMFVYKDYIYTISSEHIHDAQTFTCQSITRRPIKRQFPNLSLPSLYAGVFYVYYSMCIVIW